MAPSSATIEARRQVIRKLLREGRIGPDARIAPAARTASQPSPTSGTNRTAPCARGG